MQVLHKITYRNTANALFINSKLLFDLLVFDNPYNMLLNLCEEILPSFQLLGLQLQLF